MLLQRFGSFARPLGRLVRLALAAVVLALALPGCNGNNKDGNEIDVRKRGANDIYRDPRDSSDVTPEMTTGSTITGDHESGGDTTGGRSQIHVSKLTVVITDHKIDMPEQVASGPVIIDVVNQGTQTHSLEVEGKGFNAALSADLKPGESASMDADLKTGTYTVYCPIDDHRKNGQQVQLTAVKP